MAIRMIKDLYRYKQSPYFDKLNKKDRVAMQRAIRHYSKIIICKNEEDKQ
jgi:hypothetical protein